MTSVFICIYSRAKFDIKMRTKIILITLLYTTPTFWKQKKIEPWNRVRLRRGRAVFSVLTKYILRFRGKYYYVVLKSMNGIVANIAVNTRGWREEGFKGSWRSFDRFLESAHKSGSCWFDLMTFYFIIFLFYSIDFGTVFLLNYKKFKKSSKYFSPTWRELFRRIVGAFLTIIRQIVRFGPPHSKKKK